MPLSFRPLCASLALALLVSPATAGAQAKAAAPPAACADFYGHANAGWLRANPLPPGAERLSRWDQLVATSRGQRDALLSPAPSTAGPASQRLADFIASGLDEAAAETSGLQAVQPLLDQIGKIRKPRDVAEVIAALHARGLPVLFTYTVDRDEAGMAFVRLSPGGLGLPDPAFYTSEDPDLRRADAIYRAYLAGMMQLTGAPPAKLAEHSGWAVGIEVELAKATVAGAGVRSQVQATADAAKAYPALRLGEFLRAQSVSAGQIVIDNPAFFRAAATLVEKSKPDQWKAYLRAQVVNDLAPYLGRAFRTPHMKMFDEFLGGKPTQARGAWLQDFVLAQAPLMVDAAFQERHLPEPQRQRAQAIADGVRAAQSRAIDRASWLSPAGKAKAQERLKAMQIEIGRPIAADAFASLEFRRDQFAANVLALRKWQRADAVARAHQAWPVAQWQPLVALMPQENRLLVSTSLLQSPVLEGTAGAGDFGALGALIGQQLSLGFQAWDGADASAWNTRAAPLVAQFNAYSAAGGPTKVNGAKTLSQNQADLAGIELAWDALSSRGPVDNASARAFFTGWAGVWARQDQPTALATAQASSLHAPSRWRVNGPLSNLPAFAGAFACKGKVAMLRPAKDQVALWR